VARRASLRARFALWTALAIVATIAAYSTVVYLFLGPEFQEFRRGEEQAEEQGGEEVWDAIGVAGPLALAGGVIAALLLSKRALAPIDDVIAAAGDISAHDLHTRLPVPARDDELRQLVLALNGLLARLEDGFGALARQAAEASHELRTPLAVIATELEVALRRPRGEDEWRAVATRTLDEIRRLTGLVEALLELSRAGAPAAGGADVDLLALVEQVCGALSGAADARGVALELGASAAITVRGHGGALEGALRNLVGNALRFTPRGGRVEVSLDAGHDEVRIHVDDTGPGVDPAERARVFEPFQRGRAAKDASGVGLGLAIVKKVAQAHGGEVAASTSPLGGARFTIALPVTPPISQ